MGGNPFESEQVHYVSKVFVTLARAVDALRREYFFLSPRNKLEFFAPSPTYLPSSPFPGALKFKGQFMYEGRNPDSYRRSIFLADYNGKTVLVKFCERYSEAGHRNLADVGLAPTLYYASEVLGGLIMVVMDLVDGRDAYHEFMFRSVPQTVLKDIKRALARLHSAHLVYGDMRCSNIMVVKQDKDEWRGLLVDFDWCGHIGKAKYPPTLNTSGEIKWAMGVELAVEMKPKHDLDMMEMIERGTERFVTTFSSESTAGEKFTLRCF
jgi:serine/threonine protein kinase